MYPLSLLTTVVLEPRAPPDIGINCVFQLRVECVVDALFEIQTRRVIDKIRSGVVDYFLSRPREVISTNVDLDRHGSDLGAIVECLQVDVVDTDFSRINIQTSEREEVRSPRLLNHRFRR